MQAKFENVGKNLKLLRLSHGMSQEEFCSILGVNQSQYSKIERGVQSLSARQIIDTCEKFGITPDRLFL